MDPSSEGMVPLGSAISCRAMISGEWRIDRATRSGRAVVKPWQLRQKILRLSSVDGGSEEGLAPIGCCCWGGTPGFGEMFCERFCL